MTGGETSEVQKWCSETILRQSVTAWAPKGWASRFRWHLIIRRLTNTERITYLKQNRTLGTKMKTFTNLRVQE